MSEHPDDSVAVSLPPQSGSNNGDGQRSTIKNACSAVTSPLSKIWSPLAYDVGRTVEWLTDHVLDMQDLIGLVSHLILCMIMTILLPISLPWKLITKGRFTLTWKWLLAASCIAISLDPLFFYIPFIDDNKKCLGMDTKLRAAALALRSLTDLAFALHIEALIHDRIDVPPNPDISPKDHAFACVEKRRKWLSKNIIIDFIGILPIPQVTILIAFFKTRWSAGIGNVFLLLQFFARGYQIYHLQRQFRMLRKWTTSAFYFFMYIIAGNVLGAFWYILSIQREMSCWHQACRNITGCVATNYCEDNNSSANIMLLNEFCPINPSNATLYDFGVFLGALQSGNTGPISFWTKYFYTFWWGIKNLSNFGTNLETSNYVWENFCTIFISIVGLLLFVYLMGNVQTYILWESTRALKDQEKTFKAKYQALDKWLSRSGIPKELKTEVVKIIKQNKVVQRNYSDGLDVSVDLVFVFNAIKADDDIKWEFWKHFCLNPLQKVTILQHQFTHLFKELLDDLDPVSYDKDDYVVQQGKPDDKMLIITEGVITCEDINTTRFEQGEVYGQELLSMDVNRPTPMSTRNVKCERKVEAFALTADKLKGIVRSLERVNEDSWKYRLNDLKNANKAYQKLTSTRSEKMDGKEKKIREWLSINSVPDDLQMSIEKHIRANHHVLEKNLDAEVDVKYLFNIGLPWDIQFEIKKHLCMSTLYKVPVLKYVHEDVLHRICMSLELVILPKKSCIVTPRRVLDRMLIIVEGEITLSGGTSYESSREITKGKVEATKKKGDFFGEELLTWAFPGISKSGPYVSNNYVECYTKVEAFVLTKEGVESLVAYYRDGINKVEQLENGRDSVADTKGASSSTTIEQRLDQLIQLQGDILQHQATIRDEMGRQLEEMAAFLGKLGYPGLPGAPPPPPPPAA